MKCMDSPGLHMLGTTFIILGGLALLVFFSGAQTPKVPSLLLFAEENNSTSLTESVEKLNIEKSRSTWTTRAARWEIVRGDRDKEDHKNWLGRQKMRKLRSEGSLWWDGRAEQYFQSKLEKSQFPTNCSEAHWIAHYDYVAGRASIPDDGTIRAMWTASDRRWTESFNFQRYGIPNELQLSSSISSNFERN